MNTLYMMIGLPGSGKSTFIKNKFREDELVLSKDLIRLHVFNTRYDKGLEPLVNKVFSNILDYTLFQKIDVVVDNTTIKLEDQQYIINKAKQYNYDVIVIHMDIPARICKKRDKQRLGDLGDVITNMSKQKKLLNFKDHACVKAVLTIKWTEKGIRTDLYKQRGYRLLNFKHEQCAHMCINCEVHKLEKTAFCCKFKKKLVVIDDHIFKLEACSETETKKEK